VSPLAWTLAWIAAGATTLFAGGALYVSLVEHPARQATGPPMAVAQFRTSYPRGARLQGGLAALGALAAAGTWLAGGWFDWVAAGALLASVIPYTLLVVFPTNRRLLDRSLSPDAPEARRLLRLWGVLHAVRTVAGLAAAAAMAHLLARG
jgi:anthrone oxygenase-like protein